MNPPYTDTSSYFVLCERAGGGGRGGRIYAQGLQDSQTFCSHRLPVCHMRLAGSRAVPAASPLQWGLWGVGGSRGVEMSPERLCFPGIWGSPRGSSQIIIASATSDVFFL